ncbi:uncharacterized protein PHALS_14601 [Plasmopara halstedii]|uniref:Uncharacterized protein n=1 Tax=Plasmopara halstedii TaxID=4781 RepID=A0A0P1ALH9_PLAHL|nr:uncharacterized protein PHALS_14601 [Plasmopara halstedii]CEG42173.1 hypothetical protein PHALS_14601 [Plasmopara halstedii]|eukprot:XP_024578542.1 hypothetical protein PHALS_14601 [Plasmopara halstedii]
MMDNDGHSLFVARYRSLPLIKGTWIYKLSNFRMNLDRYMVDSFRLTSSYKLCQSEICHRAHCFFR